MDTGIKVGLNLSKFYHIIFYIKMREILLSFRNDRNQILVSIWKKIALNLVIFF